MRFLLEIMSPAGHWEKIVVENVKVEHRVIFATKVGEPYGPGIKECDPISIIKTAPSFSLEEYPN